MSKNYNSKIAFILIITMLSMPTVTLATVFERFLRPLTIYANQQIQKKLEAIETYVEDSESCKDMMQEFQTSKSYAPTSDSSCSEIMQKFQTAQAYVQANSK